MSRVANSEEKSSSQRYSGAARIAAYTERDVMPESLLRIAAIDFLNPAPLMWDFEHEPGKSRLAERYKIRYSMPARCAEDLFTGFADIGLVPAAAYAIDPSLLIIPGCAIASKGRIRSIILVTRESGPEAARTVATDTSSLTSAAYTQILFRKYWNRDAKFIPFEPNLEAMLQAADCALLIGDPALLALEDSEARFERTGEILVYYDLGHEWLWRTGVPWVSAFWGVRGTALERTSVSRDELVADFIASRNHGLARIEDLVEEWSGRISLSKSIIRTYLSENIHYVLDEACIEGLRTFYRYASEYGVLPQAPDLRIL
jgi:chorismate dehydratase